MLECRHSSANECCVDFVIPYLEVTDSLYIKFKYGYVGAAYIVYTGGLGRLWFMGLSLSSCESSIKK